ncbi:MAG: IS1 family transposase [Candidatus Endonucleobacter sp. (ex Gigantidas childressi)]|nr:IS1 family transposase [Candidatus Endonucleobacter sp. (ex Gigantidas childressi)]
MFLCIEMASLNFRNRIKRLTRRKICYSRSEETHDKVIVGFINCNDYQLD